MLILLDMKLLMMLQSALVLPRSVFPVVLRVVLLV